MGLFDGLMGTKHPPLDAGSEAAQSIDANAAFADFVKSANDKIEAVVGEGPLFAFVGKPPKAFGIVWFDGGERFDVRGLMERGAMSRESATRFVHELGTIYGRYSDVARYEHKVAGHKIVVTPSAAMHDDVAAAVAQASS